MDTIEEQLTALAATVAALESKVAIVEAKVGIAVALPLVEVIRSLGQDDSFVVEFKPVPGAVDYRVCPATDDSWCKYSGGNTIIQVNGRLTGQYIIEAVDAMGPFIDPTLPMSMPEIVNGHGDPANVPNVIARSVPLDAPAYVPASYPGTLLFSENGRNMAPFKPLPIPVQDTQPGSFYGMPNMYSASSNGKWTMEAFGCYMPWTYLHAMHEHWEIICSDAGGPDVPGFPNSSSWGWHTANGSVVMKPEATASLSAGVFFTIQRDAHVNGREWFEFQFTCAGDILKRPGKIDDREVAPGFIGVNRATDGGQNVRIRVMQEWLEVIQYDGGRRYELGSTTNQEHGFSDFLEFMRSENPAFKPAGFQFPNGTEKDIDLRQTFNVWLTATTVRVQECDPFGAVLIDQTRTLAVPLTWGQVQVRVVDQIYHTGNIHGEMPGAYEDIRMTNKMRGHYDNCAICEGII